jgi:sirohydrochlorin cobaltochelatase
MLYAQEDADPNREGYRFAANEIIRGIMAVSDLSAAPAAPGWIAVGCASAGMARWLAEAIAQENVQARCQGVLLLVPVGDYFSLKAEIKNVITAVAKTSHYWQEHLPAEVKQTLAWQERMAELKLRVKNWLCVGRTAKDKSHAAL